MVEELNDGKTIIPTIVFDDGSILVEPSNAELAAKLGLQTTAKRAFYDLIVVGSGPAGLTAALYAAREGIDTLVIERGGVGGQAGVTERLDNFPGFPEGITGAEFADRLRRRPSASASRSSAPQRSPGSAGWQLPRACTPPTAPSTAPGPSCSALGSTYRGWASRARTTSSARASTSAPPATGRSTAAARAGDRRRQLGRRGGAVPHQFAATSPSSPAATAVGQQGRRREGRGEADDRGHHQRRRRPSSTATSGSTTCAHRRAPGSARSTPAACSSSSASRRTPHWSQDLVDLDEHGFILTDAALRPDARHLRRRRLPRRRTKQAASAAGEGAAVALAIRRYVEPLTAGMPEQREATRW